MLVFPRNSHVLTSPSPWAIIPANSQREELTINSSGEALDLTGLLNTCQVSPTWQPSILIVAVSALVALAAFLVPMASAQEAGQLTLTRLQVSLWPEYDDPRLLVLYRGEFAETQAFPREISFRIPATAEVNAAAYADDDGRLMANPFKTQVEGDEQVITYPIPKPSFHFEFYDDVIQGEPSGREFSFTLSLPYPVQSLQVDVQEPLRATVFQVSPVASRVITGTDGFRYFVYDLGSLEPGQSVQLSASYAKPDARPSVEATVPPVAPTTLPAVEEPGVGARGAQPLLVLAAVGLGGVGAALIAGALLMRSRGRRRAPVPSRQPAARRPVPTKPVPEPRAKAVASFCTQCGHQLSPGARFCSWCGTPVRMLSEEGLPAPAGEGEDLPFGGRVINDRISLQVSRRLLTAVAIVLVVLVALVLGWWLGHQTAARSVGWLASGTLLSGTL